MLSPRMAKVMLNKYRKDNPMATFNSFPLEPKYGWGHEAWIKDLSKTIEEMEFPPDWNGKDVKNYISKFVLSCEHKTPSSAPHPRKQHGWD